MTRSLLWFACSLLVACGSPVIGGSSAKALRAQGAGEGGGGSGAPGAKPWTEGLDRHCILPWGPDLNEVLGTDIRILTGPGGCDPIALERERFAPLLAFWFNDPGGSLAIPLLYPEGYAPSDPDPLRAFWSALRSTTYVVQPSGRSYTFTAAQLVRQSFPSTVGDLWGGSGFFADSWSGLRARVLLPLLPPLRAGEYTIDLAITFEEPWCDGTDPLGCFPAGTTSLGTYPLTVASRW